MKDSNSGIGEDFVKMMERAFVPEDYGDNKTDDGWFFELFVIIYIVLITKFPRRGTPILFEFSTKIACT